MTDEKQKLLYKLNDINEDAHGYTYETWVAADKLEEEADKLEEDSKNLTKEETIKKINEADNKRDEAEDKRVEASNEQANDFKDLFRSQLSDEDKKAFWQYVKAGDKMFNDEPLTWYLNDTEREQYALGKLKIEDLEKL